MRLRTVCGEHDNLAATCDTVRTSSGIKAHPLVLFARTMPRSKTNRQINQAVIYSHIALREAINIA